MNLKQSIEQRLNDERMQLYHYTPKDFSKKELEVLCDYSSSRPVYTIINKKHHQIITDIIKMMHNNIFKLVHQI